MTKFAPSEEICSESDSSDEDKCENNISNSIVEELEDLITNDIHIGESDRARLRIAQMEEKRLRKANEGRAKNKNQIDILFKDMVEVK